MVQNRPFQRLYPRHRYGEYLERWSNAQVRKQMLMSEQSMRNLVEIIELEMDGFIDWKENSQTLEQ